MINRFLQLKKEKKLLHNILSLLVLQGANYILPLITLPYLVITLGVEKFGILAFATALITYFTIIVDFGFNFSATRTIATHIDHPHTIRTTFSSVMILKTFLLLCALGIMFSLSHFFTRFQSHEEVFFLTFGMVIGNLLFPVWYFQGIQSMHIITSVNIAVKTLFTIAIFLFIHSPDDYLLVPLLQGLGAISGGMIAFFIALKNIKLCIPTWEQLILTFKESSPLFISNAWVSLFTASNTFILGLFVSDHMVGIYSSFERLIVALKNLFIPIYQGLFPWLSQKNSTDIYRFIQRSIPIITLLGLFISLAIFFLSHPLLKVIYNHNQAILEHSFTFKVMSFIIAFSALNMLFNYLYLNTIKAYQKRMYIFMIAGTFNILGNLLFIPHYGINAVSTMSLLTEIILLLLGYYMFTSSTVKKEIS